jgi:hypothetical protein
MQPLSEHRYLKPPNDVGLAYLEELVNDRLMKRSSLLARHPSYASLRPDESQDRLVSFRIPFVQEQIISTVFST